MNVGDRIVLVEDAIVVDAFGTDYLLKGTVGVVEEANGDMLMMKTARGTYEIPTASTKAMPEEKAA